MLSSWVCQMIFLMIFLLQAADAIKLGLSDDFSFATWCWQLVLRLRLHKSQIGNQSPSSPVLVSDHRLQPLRTAIADGQTPAVFLALLICDLGNRCVVFWLVEILLSEWLKYPTLIGFIVDASYESLSVSISVSLNVTCRIVADRLPFSEIDIKSYVC